MFLVCVKTSMSLLVRHSRFLLCLCKVGPVLLPLGGELYYLSLCRSNDPRGSASSRGAVPAVIFRVVRYVFLASSLYMHHEIAVCAELAVHHAFIKQIPIVVDRVCP